MPTLHANAEGVLIGITRPDESVAGAVTTITFDRAGNDALIDDIQMNAGRYRLLPGPILQKDGQPVPVDTTPAPTGVRRAIQILTEQEAQIQAATTIAQVRAILEQDRTILRRLLIKLGED